MTLYLGYRQKTPIFRKFSWSGWGSPICNDIFWSFSEIVWKFAYNAVIKSNILVQWYSFLCNSRIMRKFLSDHPNEVPEENFLFFSRHAFENFNRWKISTGRKFSPEKFPPLKDLSNFQSTWLLPLSQNFLELKIGVLLSIWNKWMILNFLPNLTNLNTPLQSFGARQIYTLYGDKLQ